ncbi:hypothetical protein [Bacillus sp. 1P06AnD]|uniref:hypothetical protein n=1 Tax=Bacillus sp. 1P06AnD TaxID=3132208 RepID=UPI0039A3E484
MSDSVIVNEVLKKMLENALSSDLEAAIRTFDSIVKKYTYLFDGDVYQTQAVFVKAVFQENKSLLDEDDKFSLDASKIVSEMPTELKEELYNQLFAKFLNKMDVTELLKGSGEES